MLKIKVEGIYESDTGSGQRQYEGYDYSIIISKPNDTGIMTHMQRRFIPYMIAKDKQKANKIFSRLRSCVITDVQKIDNKDSIINKDINEMNELQLQDLACLFDLYEVPLPHTCSITEMREKAILAYFKTVLQIPMETPKEKAQLSFLTRQSNGIYKLDLKGQKVLAKVPVGYFEKQEIVVEKKSLSFFENLVGIVSGNKTDESPQNNNPKNVQQTIQQGSKDEFPSADSLL